jgi:hypothetical protein
VTELEIISGSGFAEPQSVQDAKLLAPVIFMVSYAKGGKIINGDAVNL